MSTIPQESIRLGPTMLPHGVSFSVYSESATAVEIVFFSVEDPAEAAGSIDLQRLDGHLWYGEIENLSMPVLYGVRANGPHDPACGLFFDQERILLDPYASEVEAAPASVHTGARGPIAFLREHPFDWGTDRPPNTSWEQSVLYETHVRGISIQHPDVAQDLRGTFAGLASDPIIDHLKSLGITAVELLPVFAKFSEPPLTASGLTNYWGYCPLSYFAPEPSYAATDDPVAEFKAMVKRLHEAGIEVILDVVFNHTAEGPVHGPTLSFRGIDNQAYYKTAPEDPGKYLDFTGTGNTLDAHHPMVRRLILDSLRYWAGEMHVDGFRFDLATSLARTPVAVQMHESILDDIRCDPVLAGLKLIVEPWDLGPDGYQVGNYPEPFREWDGEFRDAVRRRLLRGDHTSTESSISSIKFITAHDGYTLEDLVSYEKKHNLANLEHNRDGHEPNYSANCGVEGPAASPEVTKKRERLKRELFAALLSAPGVPMILGGDELSRTQRGNNNAYCQDNPISWYDWELDERKSDFLSFCQEAVHALRNRPA